MKKLRISAILSILALLLPLATSCVKKEPELKVRSYYEYFDTVTIITSYTDDSKEAFSENCGLIKNELERYHRFFDIYYEYSGMNNLKTVNDNAGIAPISVDPEIIEFLKYAKEIYTLTRGETNVMIGAVTSWWHRERQYSSGDLDHGFTFDPQDLPILAEHTSIDSLIIDENASTVYISDKEASLDVGALGKGYAAKKITELLEKKGVVSYLLNLGGNLSFLGEKPQGGGWVTGIKDPDGNGHALKLKLSRISCVTSGSYERYFVAEGKKYHHIIDKDTQYPATYFTSVSVICKDSALADALSTALFCMSYEEGAALVNSLYGVEAVWINESGEIKMTDGAEALVIK